jgi:hypothetical protein
LVKREEGKLGGLFGWGRALAVVFDASEIFMPAP